MECTIELKKDQDWAEIENLNMELILMKIMASKYLNWSLNRIENAIIEYRRFLFLHKKYPTIALSPTRDVDEIWHTHILFTKKYITDCEKIFGEYFHHTPHIGINTNISKVQFANTQKYYQLHFGTELKIMDMAESGGCSGGTTTGDGGDGGGSSCGCGG